jgi:hypothetical protein
MKLKFAKKFTRYDARHRQAVWIYMEMFDTTPDITGQLQTVAEVNEKLQSFKPNSDKRHKDYQLLMGVWCERCYESWDNYSSICLADPRSLM